LTIEGFQLSIHAHEQIIIRELNVLWVSDTLSNPEKTLLLADSFGNTHYLKRIPEFGDRWLRVVVNPNQEPPRIVTLFFDRRVK
jgi:hypothetical protein